MAHCWAGADGCRGGWVVAVIDAAGAVLSLRMLGSFAEVAIHTQKAELTLVDIPIGLPSAERPSIRWCDDRIREKLGVRGSTVFPVPAREAVWAETYAEACRLNEQVVEQKLSQQSWGICPKIREADAVFRLLPGLQRRMRETHSEVCFRWLNGRRPVENPKKSRAGQKIRRELLGGHIAEMETALKRARREYRAQELAVDDMLDSLAAAVMARLAAQGRVSSERPMTGYEDSCGLVMEIVGI